MRFAGGLAGTIRGGDDYYLSILREADAHVAENGLDLPQEPEAHRIAALPVAITDPPDRIDLAERGIGTILWATGYSADYSWLPAGALTEAGLPAQERGVSTEPGIYFLGLPWQSGRGSSFIWGVWHDARHVADSIAARRSYAAYHEAAEDRAARRSTADA